MHPCPPGKPGQPQARFLRPFRWPGKPSQARILKRPNRFLVIAERKNVPFEAHVPDPGRLEDLLVPGGRIWTLPTPGTNRRTSETVVLAESQSRPGILACTDSLMANEAAEVLLTRGLLATNSEASTGRLPLGPWRREVKHGQSRFDFACRLPDGRDMFVEIKSVTLVDGLGRGLFPDAPTKRGTRHLRELGDLAAQGVETAVLFCISRCDGLWIEPFSDRDPDFAAAFQQAMKAGVRFLAARLAYDMQGAWFVEEVPARPAGQPYQAPL